MQQQIERRRESLMAEYNRLVLTDGWGRLSGIDEYLTEERSRPGVGIMLEVLRELVRTCRIIVQLTA